MKLLNSLLMVAVVGNVGAAENSPQFRGPDAMGVAEHADLPDHWSTTENVVWKQGIPGRGWSSPVVWGWYVVSLLLL